jgi:hypothetical protein
MALKNTYIIIIIKSDMFWNSEIVRFLQILFFKIIEMHTIVLHPVKKTHRYSY